MGNGEREWRLGFRENNRICGGAWRGISCAERRASSSLDPGTIARTTTPLLFFFFFFFSVALSLRFAVRLWRSFWNDRGRSECFIVLFVPRISGVYDDRVSWRCCHVTASDMSFRCPLKPIFICCFSFGLVLLNLIYIHCLYKKVNI